MRHASSRNSTVAGHGVIRVDPDGSHNASPYRILLVGARSSWSPLFFVCALGRIRTYDLLLRRQTLYPLSYEGGNASVRTKEFIRSGGEERIAIVGLPPKVARKQQWLPSFIGSAARPR